jgi:DNA polymerase
MRIWPIDFETYYDKDYSLSKMTTEEYIRDPRFEVMILGWQEPDGTLMSAVGRNDIESVLRRMDLPNNAALAHHAHFDGLILSHHFGIKPKRWYDTLSMARAVHGSSVGNGLGKLVAYYQLGEKGDEVVNAIGKRLKDFSQAELIKYRTYCKNDVKLTFQLMQKLLPHFTVSEQMIMDMVIRMFTEPVALLDDIMLRDYKEEQVFKKSLALLEAGVQLDEVMSAEKFAEALRRYNVAPPVKVSPRTGKLTYAFAKTDRAMESLAEHPDTQIQALVAARLGNKSTINETRAERLATMATRGAACVYIKYSGAEQTHRLSGGDKMNWQNFTRGSKLRDAIVAPPGYLFVVVDSANIESRTLDWFAQQNDALEVYRKYDAGEGPDVYCVQASQIYEREITPEDKNERQLGKVAKLGLGYQMGAPKFADTAHLWGVDSITPALAARAVAIYRAGHPMVTLLWERARTSISAIASATEEDDLFLDSRRLIRIERGALVLPNELRIRYPKLSHDKESGWSFQAGRERTKIYGGKIIENVVQALARIIVLGQTLRLSRRYRVILSVHDEAVLLVREEQAEQARNEAVAAFSHAPEWAGGLPLSAKAGIAVRYGAAK